MKTSVAYEELGGDGLSQRFVRVDKLIQSATSRLGSYTQYFDKLCSDAHGAIGFDFVSISFIHAEDRSIETVYGYGRAKRWVGRAKHFLENLRPLQDIQAAIALPTGDSSANVSYSAELIAGFDRRFDLGIYKEFNHGRFTRIFVPVILVYNKQGHITYDWYKEYKETESDQRGHRIFRVSFPKKEYEVKVIGTIEIGFNSSTQEIEDRQIYESLKFAALKARTLWRFQLPGILEIIVRQAKKFMMADVATLHFFNSNNSLDALASDSSDSSLEYLYQACDGSEESWRVMRLRKALIDEVGLRAIKDRRAQILLDISAKDTASKLKDISDLIGRNIGTIGAFPLITGDNTGYLFVAYTEGHAAKENQLTWGSYFSIQATEAIRRAFNAVKERTQERQLAALSSIVKSFHEEFPELLEYIAWNMLNLLAADVVVICEFVRAEDQYLTPLTIAGRLKEPSKVSKSIDQNRNVPFLSFDDQKTEDYIFDIDKSKRFRKSTFAKREGIKSLSRVRLRSNGEIVGIVFINYRRPHRFTNAEKQIIRSITTSAAITIKNRRLITGLDAVDSGITNSFDVEALRKTVVENAVKMTGATTGKLYISDESTPVEIFPAIAHPDKHNEMKDSNPFRGELIDLVKRTGKSQIVNNVYGVSQHTQVLGGMQSEICVPIMKGDSKIFGVLNVESHNTEFTTRDFWILKGLAKTLSAAVERKESVENATEALLHKLNNDLGIIRMFAKSIIRSQEEEDSSKLVYENAQKILDLASIAIKDKGYILNTLNDKVEEVDLIGVIVKALNSVHAPDSIMKKIEIPEDLPSVFGDENKFTDIFLNLIQNAIDAMPSGGKMSVSAFPMRILTSKPMAVEVVIADTGIGVSETELTKIFEKKNSQKVSGMGIGLSLSKAFVEKMGGSITISSEVDKGTSISVKLPAYTPD